MRQKREILRLEYESRLSHRAIARAHGVGLGMVSEYLRRAVAAGLWLAVADRAGRGRAGGAALLVQRA